MNGISGTMQGVGGGKQLELPIGSGYATPGFLSKCDSNRHIIVVRKIFCVDLERTKIFRKNIESRLEKHVCSKIICNTKAMFRPQDNTCLEGRSYRTCLHMCT